MAMYEVSLLSRGGGDRKVMRIEARSPDQAREAAVEIANAKAQAKQLPYEYQATNVCTL